MKRMVVTRTGGPEVLQMVEEALPEPGPGQVRVAVVAAGVAFADLMMRQGIYPGGPKAPFTPGYDLVGAVEKLGPGVTTLRVGQQVTALTGSGGYAEAICLPADELVPLPDGLDPAAAVSLTLNYVSAYQMLHRIAQVQPGQRVLVHGAAGGVGSALLDLGRLAGLQMVGTASQAKLDLVAQYGATPIDYQREDVLSRIRSLTGDGVDVVFDSVGGGHLLHSHRALRTGGHLVGYGTTAGLKDGKGNLGAVFGSFPLVYLLRLLSPRRRATFYSITGLKKSHPDWYRADLTALADLLAQGRIHPLVAQRLPLSEAAKAQELLGQSAVAGKIVLLCGVGS